MLAGLADFALLDPETDVTVHVGPIPPEPQPGEHSLDPSVGLLVSVPDQLPAYGSGTEHPLSGGTFAASGQVDGQ